MEIGFITFFLLIRKAFKDGDMLEVNATEGLVSIGFAYGTSADDIATITASAYFDDWSDQLHLNDVILIAASDGVTFRTVTSATGVTPVTVGALA